MFFCGNRGKTLDTNATAFTKEAYTCGKSTKFRPLVGGKWHTSVIVEIEYIYLPYNFQTDGSELI